MILKQELPLYQKIKAKPKLPNPKDPNPNKSPAKKTKIRNKLDHIMVFITNGILLFIRIIFFQFFSKWSVKSNLRSADKSHMILFSSFQASITITRALFHNSHLCRVSWASERSEEVFNQNLLNFPLARNFYLTGVGEQNRPLRLSRTSSPSTWGRWF
mgnify:CR=1 FL=1